MRVRIYVPEAEKGKKIMLTKEQTRHLRVLRLKKGEKIYVFNGKGQEFEVAYSQKVSDEEIILENETITEKEPKIKLTLAVAVPKGQRIDFLIEKVSELGVDSIVPILCHRSVVNPGKGKIERWRRIAIEASCQSGRNIVPIISDAVEFKEILKKAKEYDKAIICAKQGKPLLEKELAGNVMIIIGPEGDFTKEELEAAKQAGCEEAKLATTTLRTETAGITAVAQVIAKCL